MAFYCCEMMGLWKLTDQQWLDHDSVDVDDFAFIFSLSGQTVSYSTVWEASGIPADKVIVNECSHLYHTRKDYPSLWLITCDRTFDLPELWEKSLPTKLMEIAGLQARKQLQSKSMKTLKHLRLDHNCSITPKSYELVQILMSSYILITSQCK